MPRFLRHLAPALALAPLLAACEPVNPCTETVEIIDFKADTNFGISASEAFTRLGLPYEGPMGYTNEHPAKPELRGQMAQVMIAAAYQDGEVRFHDLEENPDYRESRWGGAPDIDLGEQCPDRIEVDLKTSFHTDDGRFAEDDVDGVLTISRDPWAEDGEDVNLRFEAELPIDNLQGTFTRDLVEDDLSRLIVHWSPSSTEDGEPSASLDAEVYGGGGEWVGYGILAWIGSNPFDSN